MMRLEPTGGLDGPAREIQVEPVTVPQQEPQPEKAPAPAEPVKVPA